MNILNIPKNLIRKSNDFREKLFRHNDFNNNYVRLKCDRNNPQVAIVVVNFNTMHMISLLLFSIFRNLGTNHISKIVIVDNHSTDGSTELLSELETSASIIKVIKNHKQRYHGPGLNQGINYLGRCLNKGDIKLDYIWILDSDTMILRSAVINDSVAFMMENRSSVIGQYQKNGFPHISSILINPFKVWNRSFYPFIHHGWPSGLFYKSVLKGGETISNFPYMKENYVLHLGESTLKEIFKHNLNKNPYFEWARKYHNHHYHENPDGRHIFTKINQLFNDVVENSGNNIVEAILAKDSLSNEFDKLIRNFM